MSERHGAFITSASPAMRDAGHLPNRAFFDLILEWICLNLCEDDRQVHQINDKLRYRKKGWWREGIRLYYLRRESRKREFCLHIIIITSSLSSLLLYSYAFHLLALNVHSVHPLQMYGNYSSPYSGYTQPPQQPEWRLPASRFPHHHNGPPRNEPTPPPPPPRPIAAISQAGSPESWGMLYNRHQHAESPPALPVSLALVYSGKMACMD